MFLLITLIFIKLSSLNAVDVFEPGAIKKTPPSQYHFTGDDDLDSVSSLDEGITMIGGSTQHSLSSSPGFSDKEFYGNGKQGYVADLSGSLSPPDSFKACLFAGSKKGSESPLVRHDSDCASDISEGMVASDSFADLLMSNKGMARSDSFDDQRSDTSADSLINIAASSEHEKETFDAQAVKHSKEKGPLSADMPPNLVKNDPITRLSLLNLAQKDDGSGEVNTTVMEPVPAAPAKVILQSPTLEKRSIATCKTFSPVSRTFMPGKDSPLLSRKVYSLEDDNDQPQESPLVQGMGAAAFEPSKEGDETQERPAPVIKQESVGDDQPEESPLAQGMGAAAFEPSKEGGETQERPAPVIKQESEGDPQEPPAQGKKGPAFEPSKGSGETQARPAPVIKQESEGDPQEPPAQGKKGPALEPIKESGEPQARPILVITMEGADDDQHQKSPLAQGIGAAAFEPSKEGRELNAMTLPFIKQGWQDGRKSLPASIVRSMATPLLHRKSLLARGPEKAPTERQVPALKQELDGLSLKRRWEMLTSQLALCVQKKHDRMFLMKKEIVLSAPAGCDEEGGQETYSLQDYICELADIVRETLELEDDEDPGTENSAEKKQKAIWKASSSVIDMIFQKYSVHVYDKGSIRFFQRASDMSSLPSLCVHTEPYSGASKHFKQRRTSATLSATLEQIFTESGRKENDLSRRRASDTSGYTGFGGTAQKDLSRRRASDTSGYTGFGGTAQGKRWTATLGRTGFGGTAQGKRRTSATLGRTSFGGTAQGRRRASDTLGGTLFDGTAQGKRRASDT